MGFRLGLGHVCPLAIAGFCNRRPLQKLGFCNKGPCPYSNKLITAYKTLLTCKLAIQEQPLTFKSAPYHHNHRPAWHHHSRSRVMLQHTNRMLGLVGRLLGGLFHKFTHSHLSCHQNQAYIYVKCDSLIISQLSLLQTDSTKHLQFHLTN